MAFETFDLGKVFAAGEQIKGMRRAATTDVLRDRYLESQIAGTQQSQQFAAQDQKQQMDAQTSKQHYLVNQAIESASDPIAALKQLAPERIQEFEATHGAGSFGQLTADQVRQIAAYAKEQAAATAGINLRPDPNVVSQQQFTREQGETQFGRQKQLVGIQGQQELSQIAARGEQERQTAALTSPAKALKGAQSLRKEFEGLESVKNFRAVQPIIESAKKAPDNGYGDMNLIYAVGKILDPGSVVREGELALTIAAGSPMQRLLGTTRFTTENGGRLTPKARQQIIGMLQGRVGAIEDAYNRERERFSQYAGENGFEPQQVVGAQTTADAGPVQIKGDADYAQLPSGSQYIAPDGSTRTKR